MLELWNPGTGAESQDGPLLLVKRHLEEGQEEKKHNECVDMVNKAERGKAETKKSDDNDRQPTTKTQNLSGRQH